VEVVALWFDPVLLGESEARWRVLAAWTLGAGVYALAGGFLLRLPAPRRMACAGAPGLPFTLEDGVLLSAPLSPSERERLAPPVGAAVLVRAGTVEVHPLDASRRVEVSAWLDVSAWEVVPVEGLGAPPPPPVTALAPVAAPTRASFGLGAPAPEAEAMVARMRGRLSRAPPSLLSRLWGWLRGAWDTSGRAGHPIAPSWLGRLLSSLRAARGSAVGRAPPGPGLFSRLSEWLARSTPLGALLGRRKAEYVRRLFDLFEEGNLNEALRYAIPLKKGGMTEQSQLALGLPGPREHLTLQPRQGGAVSVFGGGEAVFEALRQRYREAFQKLEREGRIEEAAFVLAELLHEEEEAVSFLERHGRTRMAAELAEGRGLAPGLVVRQWVLARDVARAVDLARRTGAFADAVLRLERTHPAEARLLRLLWGEVLAQAGDYGRAVDVVWPVEDARRLTLAWLERGMEVGGVSGARLLARLAVACPERFDAVRARALALLDADDPEGAPARLAFTEALTLEAERKKDAEGALALLRPAVRAVLRDRAAGHVPSGSRDIERIVLAAGDPVLRADLPSLPRLPERGFPSGPPVTHVLDASEGGPWAIHDAMPLSGGRTLVALGEAGARLLALDGRCLAHFDVPAFSLVLSVHEDRALALAPRGTLQRLSRLDLARRHAEPWCDARVDAFAPVYDGNLWFLSVEDTVMAVDALASGLRALWRVPQVRAPVLAIAVGPTEMSFVTRGPELAEHQRWSYSLPDLTLRSRGDLPGGGDNPPGISLSLLPNGELAVLCEEYERSEPHPGVRVRWLGDFLRRAAPLPVLPEMKEPMGLVLGGAWLLVVENERGGVLLRLLDRARCGVRALFRFRGGSRVLARFLDGELLLFDTAGRLVRVDLTRGEVRRVVPR
jgi:hypothetical protein